MASLQSILSQLHPDFFKALCEPTRQNIVTVLAQKNKPCSVSQIAQYCTVDISVVSRHLNLLKQAGVVAANKQGREVFYSLNGEETSSIFKKLAQALDNCCPQGKP